MKGKGRLIYMVSIILLLCSRVYAYDYSEYDWETYNGHQYAATISVGDWETVKLEAEANGWHLVTINDEAENTWLTANLDYATLPGLEGFWIGLEKVGEAWSWVSGEALTYTNWCTWCPFYDTGSHAYLHTSSHSEAGTWNNNSMHDIDPDLYTKGIIELSDPPDSDNDGIFDSDDNCPDTPNGPDGGTCLYENVGTTCTSNRDCGTSGSCSMDQEDTDSDGVGDVCDDNTMCKGNFDYDQDVDGGDAYTFKQHFGRSLFKNPCPPDGPAPVEKTHQTVSHAIGDDGNKQSGVPFPEPRFVDSEDGTVRDNLTGLTWLKNANCFGQKTWSVALSDCIGLADGQCGLTDGSQADDWRLPSVRDLHSLVDYGNNSPALPTGHFFTNIDSLNLFWSSTTLDGSVAHAWCVGMVGGNVFSVGKGEYGYVWPVRGGH